MTNTVFLFYKGWVYVKNRFIHEYLGRIIVTICGIFIIVLTLSIGAFLFYKGAGTFIIRKHSIFEFLFSSNWSPSMMTTGTGHIGSAVFIVGSIVISVLALAFATPFSLAASIFMSDISPRMGKKLLQPATEIFVGIPSVVYGWVGATVLVPFLANSFHLPRAFGILAASIVLSVMIFPTITSVSTDAIKSVSDDYREASYGLGSTRWQMIWRVVLPSAVPGILTAIVLGLARAFGEALAVAMVIGGRDGFPDLNKFFFSSTYNLTAKITSDMGSSFVGTEWNDALWSMALLLLIISFLFIVLIRVISRKGQNSNGND
jgi:phosphate transport system permease protein